MSSERSAPRYTVQVEVKVTIASERYTATTRNLSIGGALVDAAVKPAFNTRVQLRFVVPTQEEPIKAGGVVRWSDSTGFGVQFDGLRARDVWALGKYLEQQRPAGSAPSPTTNPR